MNDITTATFQATYSNVIYLLFAIASPSSRLELHKLSYLKVNVLEYRY
jgi:hypothetical protein